MKKWHFAEIVTLAAGVIGGESAFATGYMTATAGKTMGMTIVKLVAAWIVENDEEEFALSFDSVKEVADVFIVVDGNRERKLNRYEMRELGEDQLFYALHEPYAHEDKGADGKQRNKYLEYLKKFYEGWWILVLDADECVQNPERLKPIIEECERQGIDCCSVRMRHLFYNFASEDATLPEHYVPCRLFKVTPELSYEEVEHPILKGWKKHANIADVVIWHLSDARHMFKVRKKYLTQVEKSNIHNPEYLKWWYYSRLLGEYPVKKVFPEELPKALREHFLLDDTYLHFRRMVKMGEYLK